MNRFRFLFALTAFAVSGVVHASAAFAADVGLPFFGTYLNGVDANQPARALSLGAGTVSIQFNWQQFQPTEGGAMSTSYQGVVDALVDNAVARGLTPVAVVGAAPLWAANTNFGALKGDKEAAYLSFVDYLVARYSARGLHHWELWPEADAIQTPPDKADQARGAWGDEPEWYARVMIDASARLKQRDPSAKLIMGPLAHDRFYIPKSAAWCPPNSGRYNCGGIFSYEFLDKAFAVSGFPSAIDAVAINAYLYYGAAWETGSNGRDAGAKVRHLRSRLTGLGYPDMPIVIAESGVPSAPSTGAIYAIANGQLIDTGGPTAERQAAYATQLHARAKDAGAAAVFWFTMDENDAVLKYGLYDDSHNPKPSYYSYKEATRRLSSAQLQNFGAAGVLNTLSGSVEKYGFIDNNSNITLVAWASWVTAGVSPTAQVVVRSAYTATDLNGNVVAPVATTSAGNVYNLTNDPVYFLGRGYRTLIPMSARAAGA